jgi:GTP-binding protein Era
MTDEAVPAVPMRAGFCAIVGLPNVGKSTLLNRILGQRLAAVSPKPQTTRNRIVGIHNAPGVQIAFVDTPGIQAGTGALRRYMRDEALTAAGETDVALLMIDADDRRGRTPARLAEPDALPLADQLRGRSVIVALNKIDRVAKPDLLPLIAAWDEWARQQGGETEVVPIAALHGDGVGRLVDAIARRLPEGPALFPEDLLTDRADRFLAGELIREQLFHQLGQELPYAAAVVVESFEERADRKDVLIGAVIVVERDSQKGIVVGKGGARIKQLGIAAREAVSELLGCPVHLNLHVKVVPDWSRGERGIRQLGYEPKAGA